MSEGDLFVPGMTIATSQASSTVAREFKSAASDEQLSSLRSNKTKAKL